MKASQISRAIINLVKNRQPLFLWGPPGVGKSQIVKQAAEKTGLEVRDVRAVLLDPVDLRGIPNITPEGLSRWCAPSFLPREGEGILFLDELNTAPPLVQAACYQLILDRKIGEYSLPDGWAVIAAGNRDKDRAVTHKMPSALANRFVHIDFTVDMDEWLKWAEKEDLAFPTPRSWEFASNLVSTISDEALLTELLEGTIGKGATVEFMGFQRIYYQLPEIQKILTSPTSVAVPTDPAILFATCELTGKHASLEYAENLFTFAERLPEEFGVLLVREAVRNCSEITSLDAFSAWAACNSDILV